MICLNCFSQQTHQELYAEINLRFYPRMHKNAFKPNSLTPNHNESSKEFLQKYLFETPSGSH